MPPFFLLLSQLLPGVANLLAGDKTGELVTHLAGVIKDATKKDTEAEAKQAIEADPQLQLQLQQHLAEIALAEAKEQNRAREQQQEVELELQKLDVAERDNEREAEFKKVVLDMQDRDDARSRQELLAENESPLAWVAPIIAFSLVVLIFYLLRGIMIAREPVINKDVFNVVLGALVTAFTTVITFYFGSSIGSRDKDKAVSSGKLVSSVNASGAAAVSDDDAEAEGSGKGTGAAVGAGKPSIAKIKPLPPSSGVVGLFRKKAPAVMQQLRDTLGLSPEQAAGILGNIGVECGQFRQMQEIRPVSGRGGLGWMQWTGSRRRAYESWAQEKHLDPLSDDANFGFLLFELKGSELHALATLRRQTTAEGAAADFMKEFERPGVPNLGNRARLARVALQDYKAVYNV